MTYNVRREGQSKPEREWDNRLQLVCAMIKRLRPDIFGLQEPTEKQTKEIAENLKIDGLSYQRVSVKAEEKAGAEEALTNLIPSFIIRKLLNFSDSGTFSINTIKNSILGWLPWHYKQTGWLPRICTWGRFRQRATADKFTSTIPILTTNMTMHGNCALNRLQNILQQQTQINFL